MKNLLNPLKKILTSLTGEKTKDKNIVAVVDKIADAVEDNTSINALKNLYVKFGGNEEDVENLTLIPDVIDKLSELNVSGGPAYEYVSEILVPEQIGQLVVTADAYIKDLETDGKYVGTVGVDCSDFLAEVTRIMLAGKIPIVGSQMSEILFPVALFLGGNAVYQGSYNWIKNSDLYIINTEYCFGKYSAEVKMTREKATLFNPET